MEYRHRVNFPTKTNFVFVKNFAIFFLCFLAVKLNLCFSTIPNSIKKLSLQVNLTFSENEFAAKDFGNRYHFSPLAVLHPNYVSDIVLTIKHVHQMGPGSDITIAARGHGHSLQGQAQAHRGIVINMESLKFPKMYVDASKNFPFVDVSAGELWINVLHETLKFGLAPKSWTDYLHLTVGGTLSNAGISGQAFRHGPQISNVHQLEIVTGTGDVVNCSDRQNSDLFHSVLGGLGQFGVITRARISLERAPKMVKWIRVLYSDFATFSNDQEKLISTENTFDYIEGLVIMNRTSILNNWRLSFNPQDPDQANQFKSDGKTLFCLELTKNFDPENIDKVNQEIERLLSGLSFISSTLFVSEVSYTEFLDRVHTSELKLRSKGLWEIQHPWLNLLVPKSKIQEFAKEVFGNILTDTSNGPVLVYPVDNSKWDNRTSFVLPDENVMYLVAFLTQASPNSEGKNSLENILIQNKRILDFCQVKNLGVKQYLPHYTTPEEWQAHFGSNWETFARRKFLYDPLKILAPGQRIFQNPIADL